MFDVIYEHPFILGNLAHSFIQKDIPKAHCPMFGIGVHVKPSALVAMSHVGQVQVHVGHVSLHIVLDISRLDIRRRKNDISFFPIFRISLNSAASKDF